ncbi:MAG: hypothetical protein QOH89_242 [Pseudonocardiales bacterium]|nr:hypothetical protein [Pseudonocardiales bacterium]
MQSRRMLLGGVLIASATVLGMATAGASLPSTATRIAVTGGSTVAAVDGHLHPAASIAGTVTVGGAHPPSSVYAYLGGTVAQAVSTDSTGQYLLRGLRPSATGYNVCVRGEVYGGSSTTGYRGRCYTTATWTGGAVPASAQEIPLTTAQHRTGINITLPSGAAIAGRITNAAGAGIDNTSVSARNRSNGQMIFGQTDGTGHYKLIGLTSSSAGYSVCFDPRYSAAGSYGYRPRCYRNVAWGGGSIPSAATAVKVTLGNTHTGISQVLPPAGAISGTVTENGTGTPVAGGPVNVFNSAGVAFASATVSSTGHYVVKGLPAGTFRVCAARVGVSSAVAYPGQCWQSVAWGGGPLPSGTTGVAVTRRHVHTGINFVLTKVTIQLGSISGTITESAGSQPLDGATASLYSSSGASLGSISTDSAGHYLFGYLPASATGYTICATGGSALSATPMPSTGWAPRCYTDVSWNGVSAPPASATKVPLTAGEDRTGVDVALHVGGKVTGTVYVYGVVTPLTGVAVELFTPSGRMVGYTSSAADGSYEFASLAPVAAPSGYIACFVGTNLVGTAGYLPQCYNGKSWNGSP